MCNADTPEVAAAAGLAMNNNDNKTRGELRRRAKQVPSKAPTRANNGADAAQRRSTAREPCTSVVLERVFRISGLLLLCGAVVILPAVLRLAHMMVILASNATGPTGVSSATADELKTRFPNMFSLLVDTVFEPRSHWHRFWRFILPNSNTEKAREYYNSQRPLFLQAAAKYKLHAYFAQTQIDNLEEVTYHGVIAQRIAAMARQLQDHKRDDFRIEKDRCAMYEFMKRNNFPTCDLVGVWYNETDFLEVVQQKQIFESAQSWPMFLKACHLTQSSSKATRTLVDKETTLAELDDLAEWIHEKWSFRANDFDRIWMRDGNKLTDTIAPGFLLQEPMQQEKAWTTRGRFAIGLAEFKVEVYWGRAYLALLDGTHIFLRDGTIEDFSKPWGLFARGLPSPELQWMYTEGYMNCIWDLAERVAQATHADSMRIDIFLSEGNPNGCTVNENSLSSGMIYFGHEKWMARTWAEPLITKPYQIYEDESPVYLLGP